LCGLRSDERLLVVLRPLRDLGALHDYPCWNLSVDLLNPNWLCVVPRCQF